MIGADTLLVQCAERWLGRGHVLHGIFTDAQPVRRWAEEHGIECRPTPANGATAVGGGACPMAAGLAEKTPDYLFAITHLRLLPADVLGMPRRGAINFHDGPLPRYAGLNAPSWALRAGESEHGVSWHWITAEVDEGDVLVAAPVPITDDDTAFTLNARCFEVGMASFVQLVERLEQGVPAGTPQDLTQRTVFHRHQRPSRACVLDFGADASRVSAAVRSLDFGEGYANPLGLPKVWLGVDRGWVAPRSAALAEGAGRPGELLRIDDGGWTVACGNGAVALGRFVDAANRELSGRDAAQAGGLAIGSVLPALDVVLEQGLDDRGSRWAASEPHWRRQLSADEALVLSDAPASDEPSAPHRVAMPVGSEILPGGGGVAGDRLLAAVLLFLTRRAGRTGTVGLSVRALRDELEGLGAFYHAHPPLAVPRPEGAWSGACEALAASVSAHHDRGTFLVDLCARAGLAPFRPPVCAHRQVAECADGALPAGCGLAVWVADDGAAVHWAADPAVLDRAGLDALVAQCAAFFADAARDPQRSTAAISLLADAERAQVLGTWNKTQADYDRAATIHGLIRGQARARPDAAAVVHQGRSTSYADLDARTDRLATWLRGRGAGPGKRVGLCTSRGLAMVEGMIGILKAGAAYVPLDPEYPADRLVYMVEDAGLDVLVVDATARRAVPELVGREGLTVVCLEGDRAALDALDPDTAEHATADDLAYVIYTSGSTGRPKGVMVQHRNAVNFFVGMDERVGGGDPGTWAAVTSPSFDISVLELLWTLARGFEVVVADGIEGTPGGARGSCTFGLFYFASDEGGAEGAEKYKLLLDGARFADQHGFSSVWMPERHFHEFGGLYPNPSVAAAAVASITERVAIRSGSVVLPLHHPIRIAEEWSLVDNLSHGRVGLSFAAGWQPNDFVLMPQNYDDRKQKMYDGIRQVQALWRGEEQTFAGPKGDVTVRTLPRPVQKELPVWVTIAGNPDTYREAGELGANVLTHLLGQSLEELGQKIALYREAWDKAGHPGKGSVTLMLHTFVGEDGDEVREIVRAPMKNYLRSAVDLVKKAAWSFPTFKERDVDPAQMMEQGLSDEDMEALLDHAFERYYETSGLFGTPEQAAAFVDGVLGIGVDEIACLVDFGVPVDQALDALPLLDRVRQKFEAAPASTGADGAAPDAEAQDLSLAGLIERHGVTHLQCTPSMASMLTQDPKGRAALGKVQTMMVGGEALPQSLARDLLPSVGGRLLNMYGPTETTIWSSVAEVTDADRITIGTPIANTQLYVLDDRQQPVPRGAPGELCIGGDGVVPGYLDREELTAERFVPDPFREGARIYRTGDLVRWGDDGQMEFLGRLDHQVKVRGYRIELGEIESALADHASVQQAVVIAREDQPGDIRLVGYAIPVRAGERPDEAALKEWLRERLPEFMVPAHLVFLAEFPQTPNRKVDRKALPQPGAGARKGPPVPAADDREAALQAVWEEALGVPVGVEDNFFDLGGHSLLAVRVQRMIEDRLGLKLSLTDLFRWPTVRALAQNLGGGEDGAAKTDAAAKTGSSRGARRRAMMSRRR